MVGTVNQLEFQLPRGKTARALLSLTVAVAVLAVIPPSAVAQFIPCKIVNLNVVPPTLVQAGQPFQVTTNLTVSCDPSVLPVIRVGLLDATTSKTLSTNSAPYYPYSSSFPASVVSQATARQLTGSWALQVEAYVISGLTGRSLASTGQLFQVNVEPYTPPITEMQTTEMTTQFSNPSFPLTTQVLPAATQFENATETTTSSELAASTQMNTGSVDQLLLIAAILLIGIMAFVLLVFASNKRCGQCGAEMNYNEKYCTKCGAKQTT